MSYDTGLRGDYAPLTWIGRVPVYASGILAVLATVGMLTTVVAGASDRSVLSLAFVPSQFWRGHVWQLLTYPWIEMPSFFWLFGCFCLVSWGSQVEQFIGRSRWYWLTGALWAGPALVASVFHWAGVGTLVMGSLPLAVGFFVAFATIYPEAEWFGWVKMKHLAFVGVALVLLGDVATQDFQGIVYTVVNCAIGFGGIRMIQRGGLGEWMRTAKEEWGSSRDEAPVSTRSSSRVRPQAEDDSLHGVDDLLDKISASGFQSLTDAEKKRLEKARRHLIDRREK